MNFQALKWMVDNLVQTFKCPDCGSSVSDEFIEIVGTAWTSLNIDIECPKCERHSMLKAQVYSMNIPMEMIIPEQELEKMENQEMEIMQEKLSKIKNFDKKMEEISKNKNESKNLIKDEEIVSLNKTLKNNNISMWELFGE